MTGVLAINWLKNRRIPELFFMHLSVDFGSRNLGFWPSKSLYRLCSRRSPQRNALKSSWTLWYFLCQSLWFRSCSDRCGKQSRSVALFCLVQRIFRRSSSARARLAWDIMSRRFVVATKKHSKILSLSEIGKLSPRFKKDFLLCPRFLRHRPSLFLNR